MTITKQFIRQVGIPSFLGALMTMVVMQWMSSLLTYIGWAPFFLGVVIGLLCIQRPIFYWRDAMRVWLAASGIYFGMLIAYEVVRYQPWHQIVTETGMTYSLFEYRSFFGSTLLLIFSIFLLVGLLLPVMGSAHVWKHFTFRKK